MHSSSNRKPGAACLSGQNLTWAPDDWQAGAFHCFEGRCATGPERTCIELQVEIAVGDHLTDANLSFLIQSTSELPTIRTECPSANSSRFHTSPAWLTLSPRHLR
jgi:hypothetical protein